jgi:hypothetical protein
VAPYLRRMSRKLAIVLIGLLILRPLSVSAQTAANDAFKRGKAKLGNGDLAGAIADFSRAIVLKTCHGYRRQSAGQVTQRIARR